MDDEDDEWGEDEVEEAGVALYNCKRMCSGCPFRLDSAPGWLGGEYTPEMIMDHLRREIPFLCHTKIDYTDPNWREHDAEHCVGSLIMMRRMAKLPRDPEASEAVNNITVRKILFPPQVFIDHHEGGP